MKNSVEASAPGRVCLAGEDIDWISGPSVLCAINLRVKATASQKSDNEAVVTFKTKEPFNATLDVPISKIGNYTKNALDYSHAALKVLVDHGVDPTPMILKLESNLPAKAGLSSSAAVSIASIAAISEFYGLSFSEEEICGLAYKVEKDELQTGAGQMDMYSSGLGGLIYLDSSIVPPASIKKYKFPKGYDIVIADTLTPRSTGDVIREKRKRYNNKEFQIMRYVTETEIAIQQIRTVLSENPVDVEELGNLISTCHVFIREYMQVSTPLIEDCVVSSLRNGAVGAKLTGTGMGGCMFALVPESETSKVVVALNEKPVKVFITQPSADGLMKGETK